MGCERYKSWLSDAALEALAPSREAELRAHMAGCATCRAELDEERRLLGAIDQGIDASLGAEPSPEFGARVRMRVAQEEARRRRWFAGWIPAAAGALAVLALVALWLAHREPSGSPTAVRTQATQGQPPLASPDQSSLGKATTVVSPKPPAERASRLQFIVTRSEPEVLVAEEERAGILWLYNAVRNGRVDTFALLAEPASRAGELAKPLELPELKIAPLQVAELDVKLEAFQSNRNP